jgi:phosphatidylserine/phosphatidylglycerophosphate/cardiolipin synthase-like enzyme
VKVQLLLEGSPIGGISGDELCIAEKIKERGGEVRFSDDPFINHAKYAIIDDKTTILMSENWKSTGVPGDNSFGNRGWGIVLRDREIASYFKEVFAEDFRRGKDFSVEAERGSCFLAREIPHGSYVPVFEPLSINCDFTVIPVLAPDSALSDDTILGMINSAKKSVYVQQFSARLVWGEDVSPFIAAIIEAARRGCEVKVLLDSKYLEGENNNDEVVSWLNELASADNLSLEARLADLDSLGLAKVHNKGLIVDGEKVLVCSLNWNANSVYNREAGVIVENVDIAGYYEAVFIHDWDASIAGIQNDTKGIDTKVRIVYVALTFVVVFAIFRVVKWYKRI